MLLHLILLGKSEIGNTNLFESSLGYNFNDRNSLTFSSRRNRKLNLTEYYDLVYEYKYDCLTAGIKYKKIIILMVI